MEDSLSSLDVRFTETSIYNIVLDIPPCYDPIKLSGGSAA